MRVRAMSMMLAAVAPGALVACSHEDDAKDASACPTVSAEEMWEGEEYQDYLADLEEVTGETITSPDDLESVFSHLSGDSTATFYSVTCGDTIETSPTGGADSCPDVATSEAFAIGRDPDVDFEAVMEAIDCDGVVSEREERCLRSPFVRVPDLTLFASQVGSSPEVAVRLAAGDDTVIERVVSRTRNKARIEVELDGDPGVYDVQRVRRGWLVVAGEGCASGAVSSDLDEDISESCQQAIDEATFDEDGESTVVCGG